MGHQLDIRTFIEGYEKTELLGGDGGKELRMVTRIDKDGIITSHFEVMRDEGLPEERCVERTRVLRTAIETYNNL